MAKDKEMPGILGLLHGELRHAARRHLGAHRLLGRASACYGANPYQVDNLTQITLASNIGTFLVYGFTCIIAIVAFASRHDKHFGKHYAIPGIGVLMNMAELLGVIYIAVTGSGTHAGRRLQGDGRGRPLVHHRGRLGRLEPEDARHQGDATIPERENRRPCGAGVADARDPRTGWSRGPTRPRLASRVRAYVDGRCRRRGGSR